MFTNSVKTTVLLAAMGGLIVGIASLLGGGSSSAVMFGFFIALVMVGGSYWFSGTLALKSAKAVLITEADHPEFYGIVRDLSQRAGMPMPKVAVSPAEQPNAFATGRNPQHAVVCATRGLLQNMTRDEVEGVMAHELMHVRHYDILIGSVAAVIATAISSIAQMAWFASMFSGSRNDEDRANPLVIMLISMFAPLAAGIIQMAISRSREFEADRGAAQLLGTGESLARALEKLEAIGARVPMEVAPAQAQAYIHNPLSGGPRRGANMTKLFSTHPATEERIRRLREMTF